MSMENNVGIWQHIWEDEEMFGREALNKQHFITLTDHQWFIIQEIVNTRDEEDGVTVDNISDFITSLCLDIEKIEQDWDWYDDRVSGKIKPGDK